MGLGQQHVLGDVDEHRSGTAADGDVKRFVDGLGQLVNVFHEVIVLGGRPGDTERVGLLEGVPSDKALRNLSRDRDDRDRVHQGVDESRREIGGAGTGSGHADAHLSGGAGVPLGGERGVLLVPHQYMPQGMVVQNVVDGQCHTARVPEDSLRALAG